MGDLHCPRTRLQWRNAEENPCCHPATDQGEGIFRIETCPVCYDSIATDWCHLPCGHAFHSKCIHEWEKESLKMECPLCRRPYIEVFKTRYSCEGKSSCHSIRSYTAISSNTSGGIIQYPEGPDWKEISSGFLAWRIRYGSETGEILQFHIMGQDSNKDVENSKIYPLIENGAWVASYWETLRKTCPGFKVGFDQFLQD